MFEVLDIYLSFSDMPSKQKNSSKNGKQSPKSKKEVKIPQSKASSSGTFLFFIGLSVVIATGAVILTFEDVQLYLGKI